MAVTASPLLAARLAAKVVHLDALAAMAILDQVLLVPAAILDQDAQAMAAMDDLGARLQAGHSLDRSEAVDQNLDQLGAQDRPGARSREATQSEAQSLHQMEESASLGRDDRDWAAG